MNREILFKAKRIDWRNLPKEQWWVEGDVQHTTDKNIILIVVDDYKAYLCDSSTLCQYTGLTDKNGKKIWENDIIKHNASQCFGIVKWYCGDYVGWCVEDIYDGEQQFTEEMWNECEVIGNIFDNEDLLEVE